MDVAIPMHLKYKSHRGNESPCVSNAWSFNTWNIRTMGRIDTETVFSSKNKSIDKLPLLIEECKEFGVDILCLQEIRRCGNGVVERDGYKLYYSGHEVKKIEGVGILVRDDCCITIIQINYISSRMMSLFCKIDGINKTILSVYAPTEMYGLEQKLRFYEDLNHLIQQIPVEYRDNILVGGDFNARIGRRVDDSWDDVRGRFMSGDQNENGALLLEFCQQNGFFICNTMFQKRRYGTWQHPRSKRWHALDYILISQREKKTVIDCKVDYNIECGSDHSVLRTNIKRKSINNKRHHYHRSSSNDVGVKMNKKRDYQQLLNDVVLREAVGRMVDEKLRVVSITEVGEYQVLLDIVEDACDTHIPSYTTTRQHSDWFDKNCVEVRDMIKQRRDLRNKFFRSSKKSTKQKNERKYKVMKSKIQLLVRRMRNDFWLEVASNLQLMDDKHDTRGYFAALKMIYGPKKKGGGGTQLLKLDGTKTTTEDEEKARWKEHFMMLFNQNVEVANNINDFLPIAFDVDYGLEEPFTLIEVYEAFNNMKLHKAPGVDGHPIEVINFMESKLLMTKLKDLFNTALESGEVTQKWKDVIITILFKKGDSADCNNYRGISLISHIGKTLERLIQNRVVGYVERSGCLPEAQCGFREGRSTVDMIFVSRMLSGLCREKCTNVFKVFIDLTKAYDKVNREILWMVLARRGFPPKILNLIKALLIGSKATIKKDGKLNDEWFRLDMGLKQGSVFSPLLFNIFFGAIIEEWKKRLDMEGVLLRFRIGGDIFDVNDLNKKRGINKFNLQEMLFADDAEIVALSLIDMQRMVDVFVEVTDAYGQEVSIKKTEVMVVAARGGGMINPVITIKGKQLNVVSSFKYVGSTENVVATMDTEINIRMQRGMAAFNKLAERLFENRYISLATKIRSFVVIVIGNMLYGCETWNTKKEHIDRLESIQFRLLRRIMGYTWKNMKSYENVLSDIMKRTGIEIATIEGRIRRQRLKYVGHIVRMNDYRLPKILLFADVDTVAKRKGGKPEKCYRHCLKDDLTMFNIDVKSWMGLCKDRKIWRELLLKGMKFFHREWVQVRKIRHDKRVVKRIENGTFIVNEHNNNLPVIIAADLIHNAVDAAVHQNNITVGRGTKECQNNFDKLKSSSNFIVSRTSRVLQLLKRGIEYDDIVDDEFWFVV